MTKLSNLLKQLKSAKRRQSQLILGKIRKEIGRSPMSLELKRSAYRTALRVSGHDNEEHITLLAEGFFR